MTTTDEPALTLNTPPPTERQATSAPLLPPAPGGSEYYGTALEQLLRVHEEQKKMYGLLLDEDGPVNKLGAGLADLRLIIETRDAALRETIEKRDRRYEANQRLMLREIRSFRRDLNGVADRTTGNEERLDAAEEWREAHEDQHEEFERSVNARLDALERERSRNADTTPAPAAETTETEPA